MALGTRSYGNSLLVQNIFESANHPDTDATIKRFVTKILNPDIKIVEEDCQTTIGRLVQIPESDPIGLVNLENESIITDQNIVDELIAGKTTMRLRDSSNCVSEGGSCANCTRGYLARIGDYTKPPVGTSVTATPSAVSYLNYIASTYSGAMMGYEPLAASPLPQKARDWSNITSHTEMDAICSRLNKLKVPADEMGYVYTIEDLLERALMIVGMYGVYGNV